MLEDIRRRNSIANPDGPPFPREPIPDDLTFSAILVNHSEKPVAALAIKWDFEETGGQRYSHQSVNTLGRQFLVPPGIPADRAGIPGFWNTILPGSKRLLIESKIFGDNTDVRAPRSDEVWRGGGIGSSGRSRRSADPARFQSVELVLDGVFFSDGEFLGPNEMHLWEDVFYESQVKLEAARIAAKGEGNARSAEEIVREVNRYTGPPPDPGTPPVSSREMVTTEDFRKWHRSQLARQISFVAEHQGDDGVVKMLLSWLETPSPELRRPSAAQ